MRLYLRVTLLLTVAISSLSPSAIVHGERIEPDKAALRHPIGLVLSEDGAVLYAANRRSGTLSVIDVEERSVIAEVKIGNQLSDLQPIAGTSTLLATDESRHELIVLRAEGANIVVQQRLTISPHPVSVVAAADGQRCIVASLWSRRLTFVDLDSGENGEASVTHTLDLPFAPRSQLLVKDDTKLLVADSFSGRLAIVDMTEHKIIHERSFPGHNIRGMALSPNGEMLIVAHQMLNELAHTYRNDVHWGLLMSNDLRWLKLDAVLKPGTDLYDGAHMHPLGEAGSATGDPSGLTVTSNGIVVVSLGGVGEIAIGREDDFSLYRVNVERRPTAAVADQNCEYVFVANMFDDTISIVSLEEREEIDTISLGKQPKLSLADRGERLFYNAILSHDGWMSCNSCHPDGHTNGLLNDNLSDASFGAPKRVISLLGHANTAPFAWSGGAETLEQQIHNSLKLTMQADEPPTDEQVIELAAFVKSLQPPPSIDQARGVQNMKSIERGRNLFNKLQCASCHAAPAYTTPDTYDVGIHDKQGNRKFNPPSLIGVGQRGPYFHDNRAESLSDVFLKHKHQLSSELMPEELADLLSFLRSL